MELRSLGSYGIKYLKSGTWWPSYYTACLGCERRDLRWPLDVMLGGEIKGGLILSSWGSGELVMFRGGW